jgi:transposase
MEACASSRYWARKLSAVGRDTRLIPPAYMKPFVKRRKNDIADAAAGHGLEHARVEAQCRR